MSYPSISQVLPDPFSQTHYQVAPLSGIVHVDSGNVFSTGPVATPHQLGAGSLTSPIVVNNNISTGASFVSGRFTGPAWTLPTALQTIGGWGGTSVNSAITIPGYPFTPLRQANSFSQVNVGDVYGVPVVNLSTWPQIFVPGTGGTVGLTGAPAPTGGVVIPGYSTLYATGNTGMATNGAAMLTFRIDSLPTSGTSSTSGGTYTLF